MILFLSKLLPLFVFPLGLSILLMGTSLFLVPFRRGASLVVIFSILLLWVTSMPLFANWLYGRLEAEYPEVAIATLPKADVAIVLGGVLGQALPPRIASDLNESSDRVFHAVRLYRAGKVANILISAGNLPWQQPSTPEAVAVRDLMVEFGVPTAAIFVETQSRNTHENAVNSARILRDHGWNVALLVTSAGHMPRAIASFRRSGLSVIPASTDVRVVYPLYQSALDILPDSGSLTRTTDAIKEWIGLLVYRLRGWA